MNSDAWLSVIREGQLEHEWAELRIEHNGHKGVFRVSADAARVAGIRETCTAIAAQQAADAMGCLLLTSKLYEERWKQATVVIPPCPCDVVKDDAEVHSHKVDKQIQIAQGSLGRWLVADVGKAWIIDPKCSTSKAVNHGWIVNSPVAWDAAGRPNWKGIPVSNTSGIEGEYMIQNRGAAHGLTHEDYSQVLLMIHGECFVDGKQMRTADVYMDEDLCGLVMFNQMPLAFSRQPGVELLAPTTGTDDTSLPPASETDPSGQLQLWFDPEYTWGERCVAFAKSEMDAGVKEIPNGSNNSPRIKQYLKPCMRDGKGNIGGYLANTGANWCAAFFWFCQREAQLADDPTYDYRCSGLESENDAKDHGAWRNKKVVLAEKWEPAEGDCVIIKRGTQGWQRHVCRFVRRIDNRFFQTIGGNEGNTIQLTTRRFDNDALLGFIELPRYDNEYVSVISITPPDNQLALDIDDQNDGEKAV